MISYLKPKEIIQKYNITAVTLNKWIENSIKNKNNLQITDINSKKRAIKFPHNFKILKELKEKSQRFRNKLTKKIYDIKDDFSKNFIFLKKIKLII